MNASHAAPLLGRRFRQPGGKGEAFRELASLGDAAVPALRQALARTRSLEMHRRVEKLLERPPNAPIPPQTLRNLRAINALELMASAEARRLLADLATGAPYAAETQDARAALRRLQSSARGQD